MPGGPDDRLRPATGHRGPPLPLRAPFRPCSFPGSGSGPGGREADGRVTGTRHHPILAAPEMRDLAITIRWMSLVPSPMAIRGASR
ncbi:hypothetical protein GCM10022252_70340 [Streptosporangium oxazolinicum]|uniref:Uncharacterized protein n=1 Tax=Streptosporangium oxazolinicum TaxID=909287 RepID=A0ABP8BHM9_9ACTN